MSDATPSHHLAAVWFADLVGYTALSETNEGEAIRAVSRFQAIVRAVVETHGGRVVKFLGDGALAEFPSTEQAVRSADALRADFARVAEAEGLGARELRIGIHVGDVASTEDGDLYGDGVNVASRIQAVADPGEVWVSEDVRRQLRQRPELRFASRGERTLKGLRSPIALHAVGIGDSAPAEDPSAVKSGRDENAPAGAATSGAGMAAVRGRWNRRRAVALLGACAVLAVVALGASWWRGRGMEGAAAATLAVLPFENLSGDESAEPFVLGVHDDLLTHLSQLGTIKVISRTSVMGYETSTKTVPEIAKELGATAVLEGGIQRAGDRIRMNVQLIDPETDEHLWAQQYDRTLTTENVFAIQAEIAGEIAGALATALTPEQKADLAEAPTDNLEALELYYEGLDAYRGRSGIATADTRNAVYYLERATELDPGFAAAWGALAQARAWMLRLGMVTDTTAARAALDRAMALAPDARETAIAEGVYRYYARGDFAGAGERFAAILRKNPRDGETLYWQALVLRRLGRWAEALDSMERAREADPRNQVILSSLGVTYQFLRRYDEAERLLDASLALSSSNDATSSKLFVLLWGRGDVAAARRWLETSAADLDPASYAMLNGLVAFNERDYKTGIEAMRGQPDPGYPLPLPYLSRALLARGAAEPGLASAWTDSLLVHSEAGIARYRTGTDPFGFEAQFLSYRGLAHALAGRSGEAARDARRALELLPLSRDAVDGQTVLSEVSMIYAVLSDRDAAFRTLDALVSYPSQVGAGRLRLDPIYDPLRDDPRFDALIRKAEAAEESGTGTQ